MFEAVRISKALALTEAPFARPYHGHICFASSCHRATTWTFDGLMKKGYCTSHAFEVLTLGEWFKKHEAHLLRQSRRAEVMKKRKEMRRR